jgi:hypothetical protein
VEGDATSGVDRKHLEISIILTSASLPRLLATPSYRIVKDEARLR